MQIWIISRLDYLEADSYGGNNLVSLTEPFVAITITVDTCSGP